MAGINAIKSEAVDRPAEQRKRKLRAEEIRYSPYSGIKNFTDVGPTADTLGATLGGAAQGLGLGQDLEKAEKEQEMRDAMLAALKGADVNTVGPTNYNAWLQSQNVQSQPATRGFLNGNQPPPDMWNSYMNSGLGN